MQKSIRGIILDIDGCLISNDNADIISYNKLKSLLFKLEEKGVRCILCSGRPSSFVEMNAMLLGIKNPILFEWGAGLTNIHSGNTIYHPIINNDFFTQRDLFKTYIKDNLLSKYSCWIQPGKEIAITLFSHKKEDIKYLHKELNEYIKKNMLQDLFEVYNKINYLDIRHKAIIKSSGLKWYMDIHPSHGTSHQWLAIGDSIDDCNLFNYCNYSGVPANSDKEAISQSQYCSPHTYIDGVIDIIEYFFHD